MSLIKCVNCGSEIYQYADPCPKCGYSPSKAKNIKIQEKVKEANNKLKIALDNQFPKSIKCKICGSEKVLNSCSDIMNAKYCNNCGYKENYIYCHKCRNEAVSIDPFEEIYVCRDHIPTACIGCGTVVSGGNKFYEAPRGGCNASSGYGPFCRLCYQAYRGNTTASSGGCLSSAFLLILMILIIMVICYVTL